MDEWVTTKEAANIKKVGLSQHRLNELARQRKIVADRRGSKKWWIKVILNNGKYDVIYTQRKTIEAKEVTEAEQESPKDARAEQKVPTFNIGDLKITFSSVGTKVMELGPTMSLSPQLSLPTWANVSIRLHIDNPTGTSIILSDIRYEGAINGNYAGGGSIEGTHLIPAHTTANQIDAPFTADFLPVRSVVHDAYVDESAQIEIKGRANYISDTQSEDKPISDLIPFSFTHPLLSFLKSIGMEPAVLMKSLPEMPASELESLKEAVSAQAQKDIDLNNLRERIFPPDS